jgi:ABC-type phosphate transport system substrate-binding protein
MRGVLKRMKRKLYTGLLLLVMTSLCFLQTSDVSAEDLLVITNRSVPVTELTKGEIKQIYLGQTKMWSNGVKVAFSKLGKGDVSQKFIKEYVEKNESMYDRYWKKKVFTGGGKPPVAFDKEKDLVEYVESTKGAIGYVSSPAYTDKVKILVITD